MLLRLKKVEQISGLTFFSWVLPQLEAPRVVFRIKRSRWLSPFPLDS